MFIVLESKCRLYFWMTYQAICKQFNKTEPCEYDGQKLGEGKGNSVHF